MSGPGRVLGIDTSLRSTGLGVVEASGNRFRAVEHGTVRAPASCRLSECLARLAKGIGETLERTHPDAAAVEGVFFCRNLRTAVTLGHARGVALAACAQRGVPVFEYAPRRVKQAVVGFGGAGKEQIARMVAKMLALPAEPPEDEADALALAICHFHSRTVYGALMPEQV